MRILTLKRTHLIKDGTFGTLDIDGVPYFQTIELPWKNNAENISCVPVGEYLCDRSLSPNRGYEVYWLRGVSNRKDIEIHIANTVYDVLGCIGIGSRFGVVETKENGEIWGVLESKDAFRRFMEIMKNDQQFKLIIVNA